MSTIEKLKQYQKWRAGEDDRVMVEAVPFNVTEMIDAVIRDHGEMYEKLESLAEYFVGVESSFGTSMCYEIDQLLVKARGEL